MRKPVSKWRQPKNENLKTLQTLGYSTVGSPKIKALCIYIATYQYGSIFVRSVRHLEKYVLMPFCFKMADISRMLFEY